jgi:benzoyl-CoA reductase/2-hydroxyglutaryl-CoA dehydratase subunit BcrC/BadD/HgdB
LGWRELAEGIEQANRVRAALRELRDLAYGAAQPVMPALEMLIAEMLAIHFCSDRGESLAVLEELLAEVRERCSGADAGVGAARGDGATASGPPGVRVFWVNPVSDLAAMNLLESCGGRVCGSDYMFSHALDEIPTGLEPMEALARMALADPLAGSSADRADRICRDAARYNAQAVVVSRIPGASHCAVEGRVIAEAVRRRLGLPVLEIEVPSLCEADGPSLRTRLEALMESVR